MEEFLSLRSLLTFGGAAAASAAVTQVLKPLTERFPFNVSQRFISYIIALTITLAATALTGSRELSDYFLCAVNAAFVSLSSNGGYDLIKSLIKEKNREDEDENNS